jgi:hypothetical protein
MLVGARDSRVPVRAGRVEAPFEHIALDHERPWYLAELGALGGRAGVDQESTVGVQLCRLLGTGTDVASASFLQ